MTCSDPSNKGGSGHAFLVLEGGQYAFDPVTTAMQPSCWPPKVDPPLTELRLRACRLSNGENILTGGVKHYRT